jgi:hypothetical protein
VIEPSDQLSQRRASRIWRDEMILERHRPVWSGGPLTACRRELEEAGDFGCPINHHRLEGTLVVGVHGPRVASREKAHLIGDINPAPSIGTITTANTHRACVVTRCDSHVDGPTIISIDFLNQPDRVHSADVGGEHSARRLCRFATRIDRVPARHPFPLAFRSEEADCSLGRHRKTKVTRGDSSRWTFSHARSFSVSPEATGLGYGVATGATRL